MPILRNKKNGKAILKVMANTETFTLASLQVGDEVVRAASITEVYWTGVSTVKRGANTVLTLTDGQDNWIFDGDFAMSEDSTGDFTLQTVGTILIEVNKITQDEA